MKNQEKFVAELFHTLDSFRETEEIEVEINVSFFVSKKGVP